MKKIISIILLVSISSLVLGQTRVEKSVAVKQGQQVSFEFRWPELITFHTWDKNEIKLEALVDINKGQNDDAFVFELDNNGSDLMISSLVRNYKDLPKKIVIKKDGQEYFFNTDDFNSPELKEFKEKHGSSSYNYMNHGVIMDITVKVWVPKDISLDVFSKFGLVEIKELTNNMVIHSKFGGIDISTSGSQPIKAGTKFGQKYTNLDKPISSISIGSHPGQWDWVMLGNTHKPKQELKSDFGNIYIRSQK